MILVINKIDCAPSLPIEQFGMDISNFKMLVQTCAVTGKGIRDLERAVLKIRGLEPVLPGGRRWSINQVPMLKFIFTYFLLLFSQHNGNIEGIL